MTKGVLRDRWKSTPLKKLGDSPFGRTEGGEIDCRGAGITLTANRQKVRGVDFSGSTFDGTRLEGCVFDSCKFADCNFKATIDLKNTFQNCSFKGSKFRDTSLGVGSSEFLKCSFESIQFFKDVSFSNCVFKETTFVGPHPEPIDFNASGFWDCFFVGDFNELVFRGTYLFQSDLKNRGAPKSPGLHGVKFTGGDIKWITLTGNCQVEGVIFENETDYIVFDFGSIQFATLHAKILEAFASPKERRLISEFFDIYLKSDNQRTGIISKIAVIAYFEKDLGEIIFGLMRSFLLKSK